VSLSRLALPLAFLGTLLGGSALAQSTGTAQAQPAKTDQTTKPAAAPKNGQAAAQDKKPKKVWTNDDLNGLSGTVSVVGSARSPHSTESSSRSDDNAENSGAAARYRQQLQQLHTELQSIDDKISELRNFKAGNPSPSTTGFTVKQDGYHDYYYNIVPPEEQLRRLEEKRKQVQARIDDLEDQARKARIEPGQLR
jgi:uncharacterized phage infection (PIP) family protein YhgE